MEENFINRVVEGNERERLIEEALKFKPITLNPWGISDLELIGIGGFSPLTGFMNKEDYTKVIEETHLSNGLGLEYSDHFTCNRI